MIVISAEDDPADTIRPRLDAAGADVERMHCMSTVPQRNGDTVEDRLFSLREDLKVLEREIRRLPDSRLVIIDPISSYLGGVDTHRNADVRSALHPLAALAERTGVAIVAVSHLNKSVGGKGRQSPHRSPRTTGEILCAGV